MQVRIKQVTIVDRGYHDSEGVKVTLPPGSKHALSMGIAHAKQGAGYKYRAVLEADGKSHTLRTIKDRQAAPILDPEVNRLVKAFEAAGWESESKRSQESLDFGVIQTETIVTITADEGRQDADTVITGYLTALIGAAEVRQEEVRVEQARQIEQAKTATITQQVIWAINNPDEFRLTAEHIIRRIDGVDAEDQYLYKLGPVLRRGNGWGAYLSRHDKETEETLDAGYKLKSHGGNRPTRDDPPAVHLQKELRMVLAQMTAQGWKQVERTEEETSNYSSLYFTVTYRLVK